MVALPNWPNLIKENKGLNVYALQCLLVQHGVSVDIDGSFDYGTKTAVIEYL